MRDAMHRSHAGRRYLFSYVRAFVRGRTRNPLLTPQFCFRGSEHGLPRALSASRRQITSCYQAHPYQIQLSLDTLSAYTRGGDNHSARSRHSCTLLRPLHRMQFKSVKQCASQSAQSVAAATDSTSDRRSAPSARPAETCSAHILQQDSDEAAKFLAVMLAAQ